MKTYLLPMENIIVQSSLSLFFITYETQTKESTRMGFEPTRAEPNGLAVHRLNHSATSSYFKIDKIVFSFLNYIYEFAACNERQVANMPESSVCSSEIG